MSTIDPLWTKVLAGPPTCNVQSDIYLTMILLIVDPAPKSLLLWGMGFSPCIFQTPMVYGAILHPKKNVLEKSCVILILETPPKKNECFFHFFQKKIRTNRHLTAGSWREVFSGIFCCICPWKFRHPMWRAIVVFLHRWNQRNQRWNPSSSNRWWKRWKFRAGPLPSLKLTAEAPEIFDPLEVRGSRTWKPSFFLVVRTVSFREGS